LNHTVVSINGTFDSGIIPSNGSFSFTFNEIGKFPYVDSLFPNMTGLIIVFPNNGSNGGGNGGAGGGKGGGGAQNNTTGFQFGSINQTIVEVNATWVRISALPNVIISGMQWDSFHDKLYVGTFGRGMFVLDNICSTFGSLMNASNINNGNNTTNSTNSTTQQSQCLSASQSNSNGTLSSSQCTLSAYTFLENECTQFNTCSSCTSGILQGVNCQWCTTTSSCHSSLVPLSFVSSGTTNATSSQCGLSDLLYGQQGQSSTCV